MAWPAWPVWPLTDETLTIRPNRARIISGRRAPDGVERAGEVGVEHGAPVLVGHAHDEAVAGDAGVVHEDLDRPERALDLGERGVDRVGVGDVGLHRDRLAARRLDRGLRSPSRRRASDA